MQSNHSTTGAGILALLFFSSALSAQTESVLHWFPGAGSGMGVFPVISAADSFGNLYGFTTYGGNPPCWAASFYCGQVFELTPPAQGAGAWTETVLYSFQSGSDGSGPAALRLDSAGDLIGATFWGGGGSCAFDGSPGCGTVFKLTHPAQEGGAWTESILYSFSGPDGDSPNSLIFGPAGSLIGTTSLGGLACGCGVVFELTPPSETGGLWTQSLLYEFQGIAPSESVGDGSGPLGIIFGANGDLFGTTSYGGLLDTGDSGSSFGTVFRLARPSSQGGTWSESIVHRFTMYAQNPVSGLSIDASGDLFGTTNLTAFEVSSTGVSFLYVFSETNSETSGYLPYGGVTPDSSGNLYGTTNSGGTDQKGLVFELKKPSLAGGSWQEVILHNFSGHPDGSNPSAPVLVDASDAIYGTTLYGGDRGCGDPGCGAAFSVVP